MAEEATSVLAWFEFYVRLSGDAAHASRPSRTLLELLESAFPVLYEEVVVRRLALGANEWVCVVALLEAFYEVGLGVDRSMLGEDMPFEEAKHHSAFMLVLEFVVSAVVQCDDKSRFVRDIMCMDDSVQVDIMAVIERVMSTTANMASTQGGAAHTLDRADAKQESIHYTSPGKSEQLSVSRNSDTSPGSSMARSPAHLARNAELERLKRENGILKEDNIHVSTELTETKTKYERTESENARLLRTVQELQLQGEMDLLKKERTVRSYFDERLHTLQRELDHATAELEEKTTVAKEVHELRDEIDLLRPAAEKLAKAEATMAKYKSKIEELTSAKEKLRRTEEANSELVEKNLALESQVAKTNSLQRKLTDSKEANTAIQFRVSQLEAQLTRVSADLDAKRLECESSASALFEAQSLNHQLQQTMEQQMQNGKGGSAAASSGTGSIGGISELNPELMERLARLEHENKSLRSQVDGTTSERIDTLSDEIEDLNRMKKSFETKYFDTSELLKETDAKLMATLDAVAALEAKLICRNQDLQAMTADRDNLRSTLGDAERRINALSEANNAHEEEIQRRSGLQTEMEADMAQARNEISSLQRTLCETAQQLCIANEHNAHLHEDVLALQQERQVASAHSQSLLQSIDALNATCDAHVTRMGELQNQVDHQHSQLEEAHVTIASLQESEARYAMSGEDSRGRILIQSEQIDHQTDQITHLTTRKHELEDSVSTLTAQQVASQESIDLLQEQLQLMTENLALVREERLELMRQVAALEGAVDGLQEQLCESRESTEKATEDYHEKLRLAEEQTQSQLKELQKAHEMALDDAAAKRYDLIEAHHMELQQISQVNADTITRMTGVIDEKCEMLQRMKDDMEAMCESHNRAMEEERSRFNMEAERLMDDQRSTAAEFAGYVASHGLLNDEAIAREESLKTALAQETTALKDEKSKLNEQRDSLSYQVQRLQDANRDMKTRFEGQETKLREAVKAQLATNRTLMEVNQVLKNDLMKKDAEVARLENALTRLDSKVVLFERERAHYSSGEGNQWDSHGTNTTFSPEMNSHVAQVMEEFDVLRNELKQLQVQRAGCHCDEDKLRERNENTPQGTKMYLSERIRQLEAAKSQEEDKKRELLLVNAKLIQDQKQLQLKTSSDSNEVVLLKEKINTWMLRDERRKKEHEVFAKSLHALEAENQKLRSQQQQPKSPTTASPPVEVLSPPSPLREPSNSPASPESDHNNDQENIPPPNSLPSSPVSINEKKRKLEEPEELPDEDVQVASQVDEDDDIDATQLLASQNEEPEAVVVVAPVVASAPRAKRRMSHFISNRLTTATPQDEEKPAECKQQ